MTNPNSDLIARLRRLAGDIERTTVRPEAFIPTLIESADTIERLTLRMASIEGKALDLLLAIDNHQTDIETEADALAAAIENPAY